MKFVIKKPTASATIFFRRAGYHFQKREGEEMAFVRRLTDKEFPRFHAFAKVAGSKFCVSLHLDHRRVSYKGQKKHSGEYGNSELLKEEVERLKSVAGS